MPPARRRPPAHLPAGGLEPGALSSLCAWMAGRLGRAEDERRELTALVADEPGNAPALERLAVLAVQAGQTREAEGFRRRKAEVDRAQDRLRKLLLEPNPATYAEELAGLCRATGREFDARGWSLVAEARAGASGAAAAGPPEKKAAAGAVPAFSLSLAERAVALSSPFQDRTQPGPDSSGPTLADRLADLSPSDGASTDRDASGAEARARPVASLRG